MASLQSISPGQLPEFVRTHYPVFIEFVKAYYRWLDQQNASFGDVVNVDTTPETFVQFFKQQLDIYQYLSSSPFFDLKYLKNIKQVYSSKGSEKFLVRILELAYNSRATIDYPGQYILRASDGKWVRDAFIIVTPEYGTVPQNFDYFYIKGDNKERVRVVNHEILTNGKLKLFFSSAERVTILNNDLVEIQSNGDGVVYVGRVQRTAESLKIVNGGENWQLGQVFKITGTVLNSYGKITKVDSNGTVLKAVIYDFGYDHTEGQLISAYPSPVEVIGEEATFQLVYDVIGKMEGYWKDDSGKISHQTIRLPDNFYYQIFSYVITSDIPTDKYINFANKINPAGNKLFTTYNRDYNIDLNIVGSTITPIRYLYFGPELTFIEDFAARIFGKNKTNTISVTDTVPTKNFGKSLTLDTVTIASAPIKNFGKNLTLDTVTMSSSNIRSLGKNLQHTSTISESIGKQLGRSTDSFTTITDSIFISQGRLLYSSFGVSDSNNLSFGKAPNDTQLISDEITSRSFTKLLSHSCSAVDNLNKNVGSSLQSSINILDTIFISQGRILSSSVSCSHGNAVVSSDIPYDSETYFSETYNITDIIITI